MPPHSAEAVPIVLRVNGHDYRVRLEPGVTLLDALREKPASFRERKKGCDHGQCGACTVHVNGRRVNSCLSFAIMHQGDDIILDYPDPVINEYGARGVGEIGLTGCASAIAMATCHATGVRVRELPIRMEKLMAGLENNSA